MRPPNPSGNVDSTIVQIYISTKLWWVSGTHGNYPVVSFGVVHVLRNWSMGKHACSQSLIVKYWCWIANWESPQIQPHCTWRSSIEWKCCPPLLVSPPRWAIDPRSTIVIGQSWCSSKSVLASLLTPLLGPVQTMPKSRGEASLF